MLKKTSDFIYPYWSPVTGRLNGRSLLLKLLIHIAFPLHITKFYNHKPSKPYCHLVSIKKISAAVLTGHRKQCFRIETHFDSLHPDWIFSEEDQISVLRIGQVIWECGCVEYVNTTAFSSPNGLCQLILGKHKSLYILVADFGRQHNQAPRVHRTPTSA